MNVNFILSIDILANGLKKPFIKDKYKIFRA